MSTPPPSRKPTWLPILFSAAVYPGAGQFIQGRRAAGLLYVFSFSAAALWMGWLTLYPAFRNLQAALNGMEEEFLLPDWPKILTSFGLCAAVYLLSLMDTVRAGRHAKKSGNAVLSSDLPGEQD